MYLTKVLFSQQKLNFILLGATGFTGRYVFREICRTLTPNKTNIVWGIAGRNRERLLQILEQFSPQDSSKIEAIVVDINDEKSLLRMCSKTDLIVNCCGPYRLLGEQVVNACIDSGCHHIDVSGEPHFLETIQQKYNQKAIERNVSIIGSCGFDSVPSDMGVQFLKSQFDGTLDSVETYLKVSTTSKRPVTYNFATWHSLVYGYAFRHQLSELRRQLYSQLKEYKWKHRVKRRTVSQNSFGYCVPFPGSDRSVVWRTQYYNYLKYGERPVQIETYFAVQSLSALFALFLVNFGVSCLSPYPKGRQLLMKYPNIFSFGVFNRRTQPKEENLLKNSFEIILIGKGWPQKYSDPEWQPMEAPTKTLVASISGGDLAYLDTSKIVTQITLILIDLIKQKTLKFGVLTPSIAFCDTSLIERLTQNGIHFKIIK